MNFFFTAIHSGLALHILAEITDSHSFDLFDFVTGAARAFLASAAQPEEAPKAAEVGPRPLLWLLSPATLGLLLAQSEARLVVLGLQLRLVQELVVGQRYVVGAGALLDT